MPPAHHTHTGNLPFTSEPNWQIVFFSRQLLCLETKRPPPPPAVTPINKQHTQCDLLEVQQKGGREKTNCCFCSNLLVEGVLNVIIWAKKSQITVFELRLGTLCFAADLLSDMLLYVTLVKGCNPFMQSVISLDGIWLHSHPEGTSAINNRIYCTVHLQRHQQVWGGKYFSACFTFMSEFIVVSSQAWQSSELTSIGFACGVVVTRRIILSWLAWCSVKE